MDWCRLELEQQTYEPKRQVFDWDNPEMRARVRPFSSNRSLRGVCNIYQPLGKFAPPGGLGKPLVFEISAFLRSCHFRARYIVLFILM
jgi:hypothetical protein